jgi:glucose/arabinose dehydrogenase
MSQALPTNLRIAFLACALTVASCAGSDTPATDTPPSGAAPVPAPEPAPPAPPEPAPPLPPSPADPVRVVTVASGLSNPWSLAFLPDATMLVTERGGSLKRLGTDGALLGYVTGVPTVAANGQGGLLDVALARDFASSRRLFLSFCEPGTGGEAGTNGLAVGTGVLSADGASIGQWQVILRQSPKVASNGHFGGRIVVGDDGTLFVTAGDRQATSERDKAQDLGQGHGKVFRVHADGSVPGDNPFVGTQGAQPQIWTYGHRNPQGAALRPGTGQLWTHEHGPQGGDEVNLMRPGLNYGWPRVSYGCDYGGPIGTCTPVGGASTGPGYEPPVTYWVPTSIAPSGMAFYDADRFPEWRGNLFVGALAGMALWRIVLDGDTVVQREPLFTELGERIRDVRQGPDGWLYLLTDSSAGRLLRVER